MTDQEFFREMVTFFGYRRAFGILGHTTAWRVMGVQSGEDLDRMNLGEDTAWYRVRVDLKRFKSYLDAKGADLGDVDELQARIQSLGPAATA